MKMIKLLLRLCHISFYVLRTLLRTNASGQAINDEILCELIFLKAKTFSFSQILVLEIWANKGGYQLQKGQKLLLSMKKGTLKGKYKKTEV